MAREFTFRFEGQVGVWRVALIGAAKAEHVIAQLKPSLFEVYRPMETRIRKVNGQGRTEERQVPILPGYLFVRNLCDKSPPLSTIRGINNVLPNACSPAIIERARQLVPVVALTEAAQEVVEAASPVADYAPGDEIETKDGLLQMIFQGRTADDRIAALCAMFGTTRILEFSPDKVRPRLSQA